MKDYRNVAEEVFRRSGEIIERNNRRRKTLVKIGTSAGCLAAAGTVGLGVWRASGKPGISGDSLVESAGQFANDGKDHSGESDTVVSSASKGGTDSVPSDSSTESVPSGSNDTVGPIGFYNWFYIPLYPFGDWDIENRTLITNYKTDGEDKYRVPENGEVFLTRSVREALETYGDSDEKGEINYFVIIDYYKNGKELEPTEELWESERGKFLGSNFGLENHFLCGYENRHCHIFATLTKDRLENFPVSEEYGYMIYLYTDCHKREEDEIGFVRHDEFGTRITEEPIIYCDESGKVFDVRYRSFFSRKIQTRIDGFRSDSRRITYTKDDGFQYDDSKVKYSPDNGTVIISDSLKEAIERFGAEDGNGEIQYNVLIEYYKDGERIETTKELWESVPEINSFGSHPGFGTTSYEWGKHTIHSIHTNASKEQIESFSASEEYGIVLYLYNDYYGYESKPNGLMGVFNGGIAEAIY